MAGITLAIANAKLTAALDAYDIAVNSDSYGKSGGQINSQVKHQPLDKLQAAIDYWQNWVDKFSGNQQGMIISQPAPK